LDGQRGHGLVPSRREERMTLIGGMLWWIVLGALLGWVAAWWMGRSSQRLLTEPELRIVERRVDNPQHVARIAALDAQVAELEGEAAVIPTLRARIEELMAAPPRVVEKVVTRTVEKVVEKPVERIVEKPVERIVERTVPDVAAIAERDAALRVRGQRIEHLQALAEVQAARIAEVTATAVSLRAEAAVVGKVGIERIEGIGPKIAELLAAKGLGSFEAIAQASVETLRAILDEAGPAYRIADPSTWPEQARLAAEGRWDALQALQDVLDAGRR
jgi:predicted flap endonuclease-1-like 5' DNA nuclease